MGVFSPVGSSKVTLNPGASERASNPTVITVSMPTGGTEYSYTLPVGTKQFLMLVESGQSFRFSYIAAQSSTGFPVPWCNFYTEGDLLLQAATDIFFQSAASGQTMRIVIWV